MSYHFGYHKKIHPKELRCLNWSWWTYSRTPLENNDIFFGTAHGVSVAKSPEANASRENERTNFDQLVNIYKYIKLNYI